MAIGIIFLPTALSLAATPAPAPATSWQRYVVAPTSRHVEPVAIVAATADVINPEGLLGKGITVLKRAAPLTTDPTSDHHDAPSVIIDFGKVVVGYSQISFAGAVGHPGVRLAFSETRQFLTERSDYTRADDTGGPGTDQYSVPTNAVTWVDHKQCQVNGKVCAGGLHAFRYLKISLDALPADAPYARPYGEVSISGVALLFTAYLGTPDTYRGWFESSDEQLNRFWYNAAYTNELTTDTFRSDDVDPREADSPSLDGKLVLHDGAKRDRDPYVGDLAVSGRTEYLTHATGTPARNVLADLADHQRADGWIPPASIRNYSLPLFDYPMWWVTCSWDYQLYTGDLQYGARYYPHLVKLIDHWYPKATNSHGLLSKGMHGTAKYGDYAFLPRTGEVTYYNALYVQALLAAADWAHALGHNADAERWQLRARKVRNAINRYLWDPAVSAYLDSSTGPLRHAQDGNAFAILAGVADPQRAKSALKFLATYNARPYGNAFMDNNTLIDEGVKRVYAFTSYPEIDARFLTDQTDSAIEEIKRLYGWMDRHDPGITDWEGIGPNGKPYEDAFTSMAHGWSTGVLPALTNDLLGARPTGLGFSTWSVRPHPGKLEWARGRLPTPHGPLDVAWERRHNGDTFTLQIDAPSETSGDISVPTDGKQVEVRVDGAVAWDGTQSQLFAAQLQAGYIQLHGIPPGTHLVTARVVQ